MTKPLPPEMRKRGYGSVDWNDDRIAMMRRMQENGFSATKIALAVGGGATRNAVIGKMRRLGIGKTSDQIREALSKRAFALNEQRRAKSERQRVVSGQALAERRERQAAIGLAAVAEVEADAAAGAQRRAAGLRKFYHLPKNPSAPVEDNCPDDIAVDLPPRRYRPVLVAANPGVVKQVERDPDLYAHMRTERGYHDAIAALSR